MIKLISLGCCLLLSTSAFSAIYRHVDVDGRTIYSSTPIKGAVKITTDPEEKKQEAADKKQQVNQKKFVSEHAENKKSGRASMPNSATYTSHKIDMTTQKARDKQRFDILENELSIELALRQKTQKNIHNEQAKSDFNPELLSSFKEDLRVHESNIVALRKEMQRLK